ncbi:Slp family lipoprotein [Vibrio bivalvicida]|uniref:Starvation-inducible protein n=1 Tax=Vibrio bivalvicida TaxID=1276888 RepID=A0A177Y013_9VIBR|nr:Slp family lipoprotein [Vibrio bivalvicida]OAJ94167.1 starvation-inducible protein [Vibrio bivalvicida]
MTQRPFRLLCVLASAVLLSACSSLPDNLKSENPDIITDYQVWQSVGDKSTEVRLGGLIADVKNLADQTRIEVVNLPIGSSGKPDINQEPEGRFVAYVDGFADPVTLSTGRLISLLGQSQGREQGKVGEYAYDFPVMKANGFHLWRIEERIIVHDFDSYLYPCRGLYCSDVRYGTRQGKVIQEVK